MSSLARATIAPQPGPQTDFLRTPADICIYGGAAGGGKTVGLILEPLRYVSRVPGFTAVFFRRTTPQITNPGGLWDESVNFYPRSPRADKIKFSHLQFDPSITTSVAFSASFCAIRGSPPATRRAVRGLVFRPPRTSAIAASNSIMRSWTRFLSGRFFFARATL